MQSTTTYPIPADEEARLLSLAEYGLMDTPPEAEFDRLASLAARVLDAPVALVTLMDGDRQFFKAKVGTDLCENSRALSFCAHGLTSHDLLVVPDATQTSGSRPIRWWSTSRASVSTPVRRWYRIPDM